MQRKAQEYVLRQIIHILQTEPAAGEKALQRLEKPDV